MKLLYGLCVVTWLSIAVGCSGNAPPASQEDSKTDVSTGQLSEEQLQHERDLGKPPKN